MELKKTTMASAVALLLGGAGCSMDTSDDNGDNANNDPNVGQTGEALNVKCQGINECAGMSECAGPNGENDCQGMNECAGMGWVTVDSEQDCLDQEGTVIS